MLCKKGVSCPAKMACSLLQYGCLFIPLLTIPNGGANGGVLAASSSSSDANSNNGSRVLRSKLETSNYDKRFRPNFEGPATTVKLSLFISAIGGLNEKEMEFQVTMFMRQTWVDPRLAFGKMYTKRNLTLTGDIMNQIWKPDTVISNEKTLNVPDHEFLLRINSDGTVLYSQKVSVVASCKMDLRNFPMDTQKCGLVFESYGSTTEDLTFEWDPALSKPVVKDSDLFMAQFAIDDMIYTDNLMQYSSGTFSGLRLEFLLRRKKFYYVVQTYIPTILIVVLSWVSFWIPRSSPPARVALGITTVLALTTLIFGIQSSMPKVSYVKGIDWFLMVSFLYVFAALVEYPSSTFITFQAKKITRTGTSILRKVKGVRDEEDSGSKSPTKYGSTNKASKDKEFCDLRRLGRCSKGDEDEWEAEKEVCNGRAKLTREPTYTDDYLDNFVDDRRSNTVDRYARIVFPLTYFFYNVGYWAVYLTVN